MKRRFPVLALLIAGLSSVATAADPAIEGRWSYDNEGEPGFAEFRADGRAVIDGETFAYDAANGQIVLQYQGLDLPGQYQVDGNQLVIELFDERTVYTRVGAAPMAAKAATAPGRVTTTPKSAPAPGTKVATPASPEPAPATGGNWFRATDNGFDVQLSGDYRKLQASAGGYVIGSNTLPGMVLVYPNPGLTAAEIAQGAAQGYSDETMQLEPTGPARSFTAGNGRGQQVPVRGRFDGQAVEGFLAGYTNGQGSGVTIVAVTSPESWAQMRSHADVMTSRVRLYTPEVSPRLQQARQALAGQSLVWSHNSNQVSMNSDGYHTGSAVNAFEAWHCCAGGRGRYEGSRSSSYQGGGLFGGSDSGPGAWDGQWSLDAQGEDFVLTFRFDDGSTGQWNVRVDENEEVYVEGRRVQVKQDSICQ